MKAASIDELKRYFKLLIRSHTDEQGPHSLLTENFMQTVLNTY